MDKTFIRICKTCGEEKEHRFFRGWNLSCHTCRDIKNAIKAEWQKRRRRKVEKHGLGMVNQRVVPMLLDVFRQIDDLRLRGDL